MKIKRANQMEYQDIEKRLKKLEETDAATCDIVKNLQITMNTVMPLFNEIKESIVAISVDKVNLSDVETAIKGFLKNKCIYQSSMTAEVSPKDMKVITGLKDEFAKVEKDIKEDISNIKPRKPLFKLCVSSKVFTSLVSVILIAGGIGLLTFINSPMFLAHQAYIQYVRLNYPRPGNNYDEAYMNVKAGNREEVKTSLKHINSQIDFFMAYRDTLASLVGNDQIYVINRQYGKNNDLLIDFRYHNNDVIWSAYFLPNGNVWITDDDRIVLPQDAERYLTSKKVKWERRR